MRCFHLPSSADSKKCVEMLDDGESAHGQPAKVSIPGVKPRVLEYNTRLTKCKPDADPSAYRSVLECPTDITGRLDASNAESAQ